MLDEKRIKEAETNVKSYLQEGLLKKEGFNKIIFNVLKNNSEESLKVANILYDKNHSNFWTIIVSYYSMYYIANAVLYKMGYKVGENISHKVTADALIFLVRKKLKESLIERYEEVMEDALVGMKADSMIESFDWERKKRSAIQYQTNEEAKRSKAKTSLERAKEFNLELSELLESI